MLQLTLVFLLGGLSLVVIGVYFYKKLQQEEAQQRLENEEQ